MPTLFSKCDECNYFDYLPLEHKMNTHYANDMETLRILKEQGITTDIAMKTIHMSYSYDSCSNRNCKTILCQIHKIRALANGDNITIKCSNCCWNEIG